VSAPERPTSPSVALVLVSHSSDIATGTAALARQMAPDVLVIPAGGVVMGGALTGEGRGLGTSADVVLAAVEQALAATPDEGGVVVMTDLGSAMMTAETVVELLDPAEASRVRLPSAAFVEGAVVAAVRAQQGGSLDEVASDATAVADHLAGNGRL
jgi:phosphoenolpyruvate---glycerone phosphotransferase subunit DhaM